MPNIEQILINISRPSKNNRLTKQPALDTTSEAGWKARFSCLFISSIEYLVCRLL